MEEHQLGKVSRVSVPQNASSSNWIKFHSRIASWVFILLGMLGSWWFWLFDSCLVPTTICVCVCTSCLIGWVKSIFISSCVLSGFAFVKFHIDHYNSYLVVFLNVCNYLTLWLYRWRRNGRLETHFALCKPQLGCYSSIQIVGFIFWSITIIVQIEMDSYNVYYQKIVYIWPCTIMNFQQGSIGLLVEDGVLWNVRVHKRFIY